MTTTRVRHITGLMVDGPLIETWTWRLTDADDHTLALGTSTNEHDARSSILQVHALFPEAVAGNTFPPNTLMSSQVEAWRAEVMHWTCGRCGTEVLGSETCPCGHLLGA